MTDDITEKLVDGRAVEKVPVKIAPELAQALSRIAAAELRLKNVANVQEGILAAQQYAHIVMGGAKVVRKFQETAEEQFKLDLLNIAEELDVVAAMSSKLWGTLKTHIKDTPENIEIRNN